MFKFQIMSINKGKFERVVRNKVVFENVVLEY